MTLCGKEVCISNDGCGIKYQNQPPSTFVSVCLREKTFANFADLETFVKVFSVNF